MQQLLPQNITGQQIGVNGTFFQGFFFFLSLNSDNYKNEKLIAPVPRNGSDSIKY